MLTVLGILFGIVVIFAITVLTGYFVAQEFAYMAVDRSKLKDLAEQGDKGAQRALRVTRRTSFMLSGAQLGITVTALTVGYVAEPLVGRGLGELLGGIGVPTAVGVAVGTVLAVVFSTIVQMIFGELFPKNLAIARPVPVARRLAWSTNLYLRLFGWLIKLFDASSNALLRALKIEPVHDVEHSATPRDLEHIVSESRESGELPADLSALLDRVLDFPTRNAEHAMVPRSLVGTVDRATEAPEILELMRTGHTRYPVLGEGPDDVVGVVHLLDLLAPGAAGTAADLARPPVFVPEVLPLPDVVTQLAERGEEMGIVLDEYGGFAGIITVEDMAEELVGEIADEHDSEDTDITRIDGGWLVPGATNVDEVARALDTRLPEDDDYETAGGMVIALHGGLPDVGDSVTLDIEPIDDLRPRDTPLPVRTVTAVVRRVERHVPSLLFVTVADKTDGTSGQSGQSEPSEATS